MALTLINRTARRVGIAMTTSSDGLAYPDTGYTGYTAGAGHPARIKPPKGVWTVTVEGDAKEIRPSINTDTRISTTDRRASFTRYYTGDESMLIFGTSEGGATTVVMEQSPPPIP